MTTSQNADATSHFRTLFEQLPDPVVEFELDDDGEPIIVNANTAFCDVFTAGESVTGLPLNELIVPADCRDEASSFDQRTADGKVNQAVVERATFNGRRKFLYRGIPINADCGFALYSDVTERLNQERQLDVLHRVFRHNLRNDLTVMTGKLERAFDAVDNEEAREALESVEETASSLTQLCSEAQTIRRVTGQTSPLERTPLMDTLQPVIDDCREKFSAATISVDCQDNIAVLADDRLRILIDCLVDNAVRHNTSSTPEVTVSASIIEEDIIELTVVDNGPGIPTSERQVITGEVDVSPLSHGSGLGLWLVKWLTESYGGCLDIDTSDDGGTVVCLRLPRARD
jgi:signal transduction histidine kinase